MDIVGIHMVEVNGMDIPEECPSKEWVEDEGIDMVEERSSNHWPEVEGMDIQGMNIMEDMTAEVVEREHEGVVLVRHWIDDGVVRHWGNSSGMGGLQSQGVQKVTPCLQLQTPIIRNMHRTRHDNLDIYSGERKRQ
jgi:hypothetical protein